MPPETRCKGTRDDGSPCEAPESFIGEDGWCPSHRPGASEKLREWASKGGRASAEKRKRDGLSEADLPPLESPQDAETWLEVVARAVATGRLSHHEGKAVARLVREWLRANEAGAMQDRMESLEEKLSKLRRGELEVVS